MSISVGAWLNQMTALYQRPFDRFPVYLFEGTLAELEPKLSAWRRPDDVQALRADLSEIVMNAAHAEDAAVLVHEHLSKLGASSAPFVAVISGVHLLAWLFPDQMLVPVYQALRGGSRAVVLVVPPPPPAPLAARAVLSDWRGALRAALATEGTDRIISP